MKSYALAMSTFSTPTLKTVNQNIKPMIQLNNYSCSSKSTNSLLPFSFQSYKLANVSFTSSLLTSSSSNFSCNKENLLQLCRPNRILNEFKGRASVSASVLENSENESSLKESKLARTLQLVAMFVIWYSLNIFFNIYNKQVLKVFPYPATLTAFQFGCGTVMILVMWGFNLYPKPKLKRSHVFPILTLALVHTFGNFLTNISLGKVAVSFTHTIKAMEPFFAVIFSVLFLSEWPTFWVIFSLAPIVGGVVLASFTEASFNWIGFASAMASNMTNQSRNVLSKKFMIRKEDRLDNISLFSMLTITSFILLFPIAIIVEGVKFTPSFLQHYTASHGLSLRDLFLKALLSGFCFHSYQQVSYMILEMVSAVTHSVANSVKRVVLIVSSVLFFRTPVSLINSLGTGLALAGVFLYSRVKQLKPKQKN